MTYTEADRLVAVLDGMGIAALRRWNWMVPQPPAYLDRAHYFAEIMVPTPLLIATRQRSRLPDVLYGRMA